MFKITGISVDEKAYNKIVNKKNVWDQLGSSVEAFLVNWSLEKC